MMNCWDETINGEAPGVCFMQNKYLRWNSANGSERTSNSSDLIIWRATESIMHLHISAAAARGAAAEIILEIIPAEYAPNDYQTEAAMFICKWLHLEARRARQLKQSSY